MKKNSLDRRRIEDIEVLYYLEPTICDIYVEGISDRKFIEWHLRDKGVKYSNIYLIDDIEISSDAFDEELENNNRDRLIFLINYLNSKKCKAKYLGIIDKDILQFTRGIPIIPNLLVTKNSCIEMSFFCNYVVDKVSMTGFSGLFTKEIISFTKNVLIVESAIRILEKRKKIGIKKISVNAYIQYSGKLVFQKGKYLEAIKNKNNLPETFLSDCEHIIEEIHKIDPIEYANGHIMIGIMNTTLKRLKIINTSITDDIIRALFMSAIDNNVFLSTELGKKILDYIDYSPSPSMAQAN